MRYNKKKNEKREVDIVSLFLLSGIFVFYALLGILMTFLIIISPATFVLKIIVGLIWYVGYAGFGVAFYSSYKTTQKISGLEYV